MTDPSQSARTQAIADEMAAYRSVEGDYMDGSTVKYRLEALWDRATAAALAAQPQAEPERMLPSDPRMDRFVATPEGVYKNGVLQPAPQAEPSSATVPSEETREALIALGLEMVRITTTVQGFDEWPAIPALWLECMRERDEARAVLALAAPAVQAVGALTDVESHIADLRAISRDAISKLEEARSYLERGWVHAAKVQIDFALSALATTPPVPAPMEPSDGCFAARWKYSDCRTFERRFATAEGRSEMLDAEHKLNNIISLETWEEK